MAAEWFYFVGAALRDFRERSAVTGPAIQSARRANTASGYYAYESVPVETEFGRVWFGRPPDMHLSTLDGVCAAMSAASKTAVRVEDIVAIARACHAEHNATVNEAIKRTGLSREAWLAEVREGQWRAARAAPTSPSC